MGSINYDNAVTLLNTIHRAVRGAVNTDHSTTELERFIRMTEESMNDFAGSCGSSDFNRLRARVDNIRTSLTILRFKLQRMQHAEKLEAEKQRQSRLELVKARRLQFEAAIMAGCDATDALKAGGILQEHEYEFLERMVFEKSFQRYMADLSTDEVEEICDE